MSKAWMFLLTSPCGRQLIASEENVSTVAEPRACIFVWTGMLKEDDVAGCPLIGGSLSVCSSISAESVLVLFDRDGKVVAVKDPSGREVDLQSTLIAKNLSSS